MVYLWSTQWLYPIIEVVDCRHYGLIIQVYIKDSGRMSIN